MLKVNNWIFWAFCIGLLSPSTLSFGVGPLRLTIYRIVLIIFIVMNLANFTKAIRLSFKDPNFLMVAYGVWVGLAIMVNHGPTKYVDSIGIYMIELAGPYFLAIGYLNSMQRVRQLIKVYVLIVCCTLLITLPEMLTGFNLAQKILGVPPGHGVGQRLGLTRSFGTFDHPILQGVFASSALGFAWFTGRYKQFGAAFIATVSSLSSGPLVSVFVQFLIMGWEFVSRSLSKRWMKLAIILFIFYWIIEFSSNRSAMTAILTNVTFSSHTAYWRMLIWEHGMNNVWANPFFGIGFDDWERPKFMYTGSMDAFWLVSMVRYGLPAFLMYASAFLLIVYQMFKMKLPTKEMVSLRRGWLTGMVGIIIASATVHLWNNAFIFINFFLGIGMGMLVVFSREMRASKQAPIDPNNDQKAKEKPKDEGFTWKNPHF